MPRDSSGNYTLPAGNPVVPDTLVEAEWANGTIQDDMAPAITDSLSRSGLGGMLGPLKGVDGSVSAPSFTFTEHPQDGMYSPAAGGIGFAVGGVQKVRMEAAVPLTAQLAPAATDDVQHWRNGAGVAVAQMTAIGTLESGLTGIGDDGYSLSSVGTLTIANESNPASFPLIINGSAAQSVDNIFIRRGADTVFMVTNVGDVVGRAFEDGKLNFGINSGNGGFKVDGNGFLEAQNRTGAASMRVRAAVDQALTGTVFSITNPDGTTPDFYVRKDAATFVADPVTVANAANVFMNTSSGRLQRSTSSLRYKKNVINYGRGLNDVLMLRPISFNALTENVMADDEPQDMNRGKQFAGLAAEEVFAAGLHEFVELDADGNPDAVAYPQLTALLINAIKELTARVEALEAP